VDQNRCRAGQFQRDVVVYELDDQRGHRLARICRAATQRLYRFERASTA
jgi:hypothetical protein